MHAAIDTTSTTSKKVLMVVANPTVSTTLGWPVGFWGSELTHPYYAFTEAGYEVTVASPEGGRCELDAYSDPRDESDYSAEDTITRARNLDLLGTRPKGGRRPSSSSTPTRSASRSSAASRRHASSRRSTR